VWRAGGVERLLECMEDYPDAVVLQENCCGALWNLSTKGMMPCAAVCAQPKAPLVPEPLHVVVWHHVWTWGVLTAAHKESLGEKGAIELILRAMARHPGRATLQKNALAALWDLNFLARTRETPFAFEEESATAVPHC